MENSRLRQLALSDLSILNFGLMRVCRREDAPPRIDKYTIRYGFLLVPLISGANRCFKFQKPCQLFVGAHDQPLSVACASPMQIYSALKIGFQLAIEPFAVRSYSVRVVRSLSVVPQ